MLLHHFTARLDGRARFELMNEQPTHDLQLPAQHHLAALFKNDQARERVRELAASAFPGMYFVIDPTGMQVFRVRMSSRAPADSAEEQNLDQRARESKPDVAKALLARRKRSLVADDRRQTLQQLDEQVRSIP